MMMIRKMKSQNAKIKSFEILRSARNSNITDLCLSGNGVGMQRKSGKICCAHGRGAALLIVLLIIMTITVLSLGFLSRSDVELACGENMLLRTPMDYLAESGIEHAKGLILSPQDVTSEYWAGDVSQQIAIGDDYYDIEVVRDDSDPINRCNYIIDCNAYRLRNGEKIGRSNLIAELRLDPCIAFWTGSDTTIWPRITVNADVYCAGNLANYGSVFGDVFAGGTITGGNIEGRKNELIAQAPLDWPGLETSNFSPIYYIGSTSYSPQTVGSSVHPSGSFNPSASNPAGVRYRNGDIELPGNVNINGMLVVDGTVRISGVNNTITAVKNFPAILVSGDVIIENGGRLEIEGLVVVEGRMQISAGDADVSILGGLFVQGGVFETMVDSSGNGNTGMLYNCPTWQPFGGQTGGALELDGADDYVQTSDDVSKLQLTGDYTLSVWIKADSIQKSWASILSKCDAGGSTNHWTLQFDTGSPRKLIVYHLTSSWQTGITLPDIAGGWHHISVVRSGNIIASYLNGVERNNNTWDSSPGSGNGHLNIGADRTVSSDYLYKGLIDDLRIYNCALDANDIYPPTNGLAGLIGHWKLDESGSNVIVTAAPCKTAILIWPAAGVSEKWGQAAGAFFRSIRKN